MKKFFINLLKVLIPLLFWCALWQILAKRVSNNYILPDIKSTISELVLLLKNSKSYEIILHSLFRVLLGLVIGSFLGVVFAVVAYKVKCIYYLLSPMISIIKSTPVASFILILWIFFSGDGLPVTVGILMVMPIIWQGVIDGYSSIDKDLLEVADVFEFSYTKRMKLLIFPTLKKYLTPGIITASGLAWKSEIAAEIIGYTRKSIGQHINDAKYDHETARVFAWSLIVIILSIVLESIAKHLLRRTEK